VIVFVMADGSNSSLLRSSQ